MDKIKHIWKENLCGNKHYIKNLIFCYSATKQFFYSIHLKTKQISKNAIYLNEKITQTTIKSI